VLTDYRVEPGYRSALQKYEPAALNMPIEKLLTYILGGLHNIISLGVVISFFLSNQPRMPTIAGIQQWFK